MRNASLLLLSGISAAALALVAGCERAPSDAPRYNEVLGDSAAGAPPADRRVDLGILSDQGTYQPAKYSAVGESGPAGGDADSGAESPEAADIRKTADGLLTGIFELDVDLILDAFEEEKIATLREDDYLSTMYDTAETLKSFWLVLKSKSEGTDVEPVLKVAELLPGIKPALVSGLDVRMVDDTHAVGTMNQERFARDGAAAMGELQSAAMAAMPVVMTAVGKAMGGEEGAPAPFSPEMLTSAVPAQIGSGGAEEETRFIKTDGGWRFEVPPISEEAADVLNEGLLLVKEFVAELTQQIELAENFDLAVLIETGHRVGAAKVPLALGWFGRAQALLGPLFDPGLDGGDVEMPADGDNATSAPGDPNTGDTSGNPRVRPPDPG